ncbi:MAG: ABC transporter permease [Prosthecobacter sp.]|nr:ABC transporter permease [Prosthecobacter sp.]
MTPARSERWLVWVVPVLIVGGWEWLVRSGAIPASQSAAPSDIAGRVWHLTATGPLARHAAFSLFRIIAGVVVGTLLGVFTSAIVARWRLGDRLFSPTIQLLSGIPVVIWIPFWVMLFGTGEVFKVGMAAVATYFLVHMHTLHAFRLVERDYAELAEMYEKSNLQRVAHVLLPFATPGIFTAIRTSMAFAWIVIFFVEYASARHGSEGLGWFIADARSIGRVEDEFAGLIILGMIAYGADRAVGAIQRHLLVWSDTEENID